MHSSDNEAFQEKCRQVGTILLWMGGVMSILVLIDRSGLSLLAFPSFWYRSRSLHLLICAGFFVAGALMYRYRPDEPSADSSGRTPVFARAAGPVFRQVRFFTRPECSLCDEAMSVLEEYGEVMPEIEFVDISGNPMLEEQHGSWIPVVEIDGQVRFRGRIDPVLLERLIHAQLRREELPDQEASA